MSTLKEQRHIFGTDGVRGKANSYPMTVEMAVALGRSAGKVFREVNEKPRVVIGKDTRLSCYMIENALISGLCSMGVDTLMVGPFPTPAVAFITRAYRADAGIVISASHNPYYDNGIKFFSSEGFKFSDEWEHRIEQLVNEQGYLSFLPKEDAIGRNTKIHDADGRYIEFAKATFPKRKTLRNLKIVLDCAHGAAHRVAPLVFKELDAEVIVFGNQPNGLNINLEVGALHPETTQKGVIESGANIGIALDGDGDRVILVDEKGQVLDGDTILAICARDLQMRGELKNHRVVSTIMSNFGFLKAMESLGIEVIQSGVGDRYVIQEMLKHDATLGGEQSGHLIFLEQNTTGDGIVSALQVLRIMIETGSKLSELAAFIQKYPQILVNVKVTSKPPLHTLTKMQEAIRSAEKELGDTGRVVVRYSGTEFILRVMVEGRSESIVKRLADSIANEAKKEIGDSK